MTVSQSWVWGHSLGIPALEEYEEQEFKAILDLVKLSQRGGGREQFHRQGERVTLADNSGSKSGAAHGIALC